MDPLFYDEQGRNILLDPEVKDKIRDDLVERYPQSLKQRDLKRRNILFYKTVSDCYKKKLVEKYPQSLKCVDSKGRNILFYNNVDGYYKNKLLQYYPEELKRVDNMGRSILFYPSAGEYYRHILISQDNNALFWLDKLGRNILFYDKVEDYYKELLLEYKTTKMTRYERAFEITMLKKQLRNIHDDKDFFIMHTSSTGTGKCNLCGLDFIEGDSILLFGCGHHLHRGCYKDFEKCSCLKNELKK